MPTPDLTDRLASLERELRELRALVQTAIPTPTRIPPATNVRPAKVVAPPTPDVGERPPYEQTQNPWIIFLNDGFDTSGRTEEPKTTCYMLRGKSPKDENTVITVYWWRGGWYSDSNGDTDIKRFKYEWDEAEEDWKAYLVTLDTDGSLIVDDEEIVLRAYGGWDFELSNGSPAGEGRWAGAVQYGWCMPVYTGIPPALNYYEVIAWDSPAKLGTISGSGEIRSGTQMYIDDAIGGDWGRNFYHWGTYANLQSKTKVLNYEYYAPLDYSTTGNTDTLALYVENDGDAETPFSCYIVNHGPPFCVRADADDSSPSNLNNKVLTYTGGVGRLVYNSDGTGTAGIKAKSISLYVDPLSQGSIQGGEGAPTVTLLVSQNQNHSGGAGVNFPHTYKCASSGDSWIEHTVSSAGHVATHKDPQAVATSVSFTVPGGSMQLDFDAKGHFVDSTFTADP